MAEELTIREARPDDAEHLIAFNKGIARETEDKELDHEVVSAGVNTVLADASLGFYLVAESEGAVVGCLMITTEWSDWRNGNFWWIQSVYVRPEFRGKGVFKAVYDAVAQRARAAEGVCGFRLYVERENTRAQKAYAGLGLTETPYLMYEQLF